MEPGTHPSDETPFAPGQIVRCGQCGAVMDPTKEFNTDPLRCLCGRRAISPGFDGILLVHATGCPGDSGCWCGCRRYLL